MDRHGSRNDLHDFERSAHRIQLRAISDSDRRHRRQRRPDQGFLRDPDGSFTSFTFPGAEQTTAAAINSCNIIAGTFTGNYGVPHGFYGELNDVSQLDYAGAQSTGITDTRMA